MPTARQQLPRPRPRPDARRLRDRDLRSERRPRAAQAPAGTVPPPAGGPDAGRLPDRRLLPHGAVRRGVPLPGAVGRRASSGACPPDDEHWEPFARLLSYVGTADGLDRLAETVADAQRQIGGRPRVLHYLSVPPSASAGVVTELRTTGLNADARVIMEKPFGTDLASARALNATLLTAFDESQIFRIDHFLGKEAVQNILALRFANGLFEPVWNRNHIDHVQIDVPETLSIGTRAELLRGHGRLSRHGRDAPVPGARLRRDGAPHVARGEGPRRREDQGLRRDAAASTRGRGARPVRGLP